MVLSNPLTGGGQPYSLGSRVEILANLIYLAQHAEADADLDQQRLYLDWAATIIADLKNHPALCD